MGRSSLLGLDRAAVEPPGRDTAALGPGDNSDSGSDRVGLEDVDTDDPVERHNAQLDVEMGRPGAEDGVDRVLVPDRADDGPDAPDTLHDDEDPDLLFIDLAIAGSPSDEPEVDDEADSDGGMGDEDDNIPGAHGTTRRAPPNPNPGPNPVPPAPGNARAGKLVPERQTKT